MPHRLLRIADSLVQSEPSNVKSTLSINVGEQTYLERHETTRIRVNGIALLLHSWFRLDFDQIGIGQQPKNSAISDSGQSVHAFEADLA